MSEIKELHGYYYSPDGDTGFPLVIKLLPPGMTLEKCGLTMSTFPLYLLRLGDEWQIAFPEDRQDIGHSDFWEQTVSQIVANHYRIPTKRLANLPYSQRRARVVGTNVYYGGKPDPDLLQLVRKSVGNDKLVFVFDNHEKRLREDVMEFRRLVRRYKVSDQNRQ